jgi:lipopolysaccharide transport system permease protein
MNQPINSSLRKVNPFGFVMDLWQHRELLWQFTLRNVELRHRGSHLGLLWSIVNPLLMLGLYVVVFGHIFGGSYKVLPDETKVDYALALFLGLTLFQLFSEVLGTSPQLIVGNPNFVKKVVFPLEVLPASAVGASIFHSLISLVLVLVGVVILGHGLSLHALWLPVILVPVVLLALGISWLVSALGVFFRDIAQLVAFATLVLMYGSAIFFPPSVLPTSLWLFLRFNPLLLAVDLARASVMWHQPINAIHLMYLIVVSVLVCAGGYWSFRRMAPWFADVL